MKYVYIGMLLRNPYYLLYDIGFVFSFTALYGLVFFSQKRSVEIKKKIRTGSVGGSVIELQNAHGMSIYFLV